MGVPEKSGIAGLAVEQNDDNECSFILNQTRLSGYFVVKNDDGDLVKMILKSHC